MFLDPSAGVEHIEHCCVLRPPKGFIAGRQRSLATAVSGCALGFPPSFPSVCRDQVYLGTTRHTTAVLRNNSALHTGCSCIAHLHQRQHWRTQGGSARHGFLLAQHRALEQTLELHTGEVTYAHNPSLFSRTSLRCHQPIPDTDLRRPDAIYPAPVVAQIQAHQATRATASPAFYERLVEYCLEHDATLPTLTKVFTGGGPVSPNSLDRVQRIAPQATITAVYGSTEAEPIALVARHEIAAQDIAAMLGGSGLLAGRPVPIIQLRILEEHKARPIGPFTPTEFDLACQPAGEPGEIVVPGEHVLSDT